MYEILGLKHVFSTFQETVWSHLKWRVRDYFAKLFLKASYLYGFITKDEKNQGKTEEILLEFVSNFNTARSLQSVIGDVKMEGFNSTDSHELAFIRPVSYVA